ncbi:MAG TPA: YraN family protein [Nitrospirae bacterium]|nr:YraN family protein [Nitrospirota bacterium]
MNKQNNSKVIGRKSESLAIDWLKNRGYSIVKTNYTTPYGEADIIAKQGDITVFVEVKSAIGQNPIESVTASKMKKIRNIALYYMQRLGLEVPIRFDVITIVVNEKDLEIKHLVDAF